MIPNYYYPIAKRIEWIIAIPSFILMLAVLYADFQYGFLSYTRPQTFCCWIMAIILLYNALFLQVIAHNICTTLLLFIARFNLKLHFDRKTLKSNT